MQAVQLLVALVIGFCTGWASLASMESHMPLLGFVVLVKFAPTDTQVLLCTFDQVIVLSDS